MGSIHLRLRKSGGTLSIALRPQVTSVTLDFDRVYTFDRAGRLSSFFDAGTFYRRGLDHRLLRKTRVNNREWNVDVLDSKAASSTYGTIFRPLAQALSELDAEPDSESASHSADGEICARARRLLAGIMSMGPDALARDADRFREVYSPVAILPPDHYLALVVQVTQGCSHNKCRFCSFYHDVPFRVKSPPELDLHMDEVVRFLGAGISLRQSLFLGDANALVVEPARLSDYLERIGTRFTGSRAPRGFHPRGTFSFVDSFHTGFEHPETWKAFRERGLSGVYLGVESGSDGLLLAMDKPSSSDATLAAVTMLKRAGLKVGVILIAGLGGAAWAEVHQRETAALLERLPLDRHDLVYYSPYQEDEPRAQMADFKPELPSGGRLLQMQAWSNALAIRPIAHRPRTAVYSLREFIY
jgi:hypothetical protein